MAAVAAVAAKTTATLAQSKTGRRVLLSSLVAVVAVPVCLLLLPVLFLVMLLGPMAQEAAATPMAGVGLSCIMGDDELPESVAGFRDDQLKNAMTIIEVAAEKGAGTAGARVALIVAIGESTLQNLDHGDDVGPDSRGLFQQQASWGPLAVRMDPKGATELFIAALLAVPHWQDVSPGVAGQAVQKGPSAAFYEKYLPQADALIEALASGQAGCAVPEDAQATAQSLLEAMKAGRLVFDAPNVAAEITGMASGHPTAACVIDPYILNAIAVAVSNFQSVGISTINRQCTNQVVGLGKASQHWKGKAVDFDMLNGRSLTGADANSVKLIHVLDPAMPADSGLGQVGCRSATGTTIQGLKHFTRQFADSCDHQHVEVSDAY